MQSVESVELILLLLLLPVDPVSGSGLICLREVIVVDHQSVALETFRLQNLLITDTYTNHTYYV